MSTSHTPCKPSFNSNTTQENNNNANKFSQHQQAKTFMSWYKRMIDNERLNFILYLSDNVILQWFGRTIRTRKKVNAFFKYDMQCSRHYFTTIESIDEIQYRNETLQRIEDTTLASPLNSPEVATLKGSKTVKRRLLRSNCNSPEWAEGCHSESEGTSSKKSLSHNDLSENMEYVNNNLKRPYTEDTNFENCNKGDGMNQRIKRKCVPVTPSNKEIGQGDCLPSTSGTDSEQSRVTLNAQLPKLAVECNGYIKFNRTKGSRSVNDMKWERKCKLQVSYSEDPLNVGEYIIWALLYTDESKCRRNLLAAFEEAAKDDI